MRTRPCADPARPHTDFIYALIVDELGLFGGAAVILIYGLIAARGFKTALLAQDGFSKLLAAGLTAVFALQAFVIIGGVVRVIPLTGVTLPFVSYGGSSIVANMVLLALLLMVSDRAPRGRSAGGLRYEPPRSCALLRRRPAAVRAAGRVHLAWSVFDADELEANPQTTGRCSRSSRSRAA